MTERKKGAKTVAARKCLGEAEWKFILAKLFKPLDFEKTNKENVF